MNQTLKVLDGINFTMLNRDNYHHWVRGLAVVFNITNLRDFITMPLENHTPDQDASEKAREDWNLHRVHALYIIERTIKDDMLWARIYATGYDRKTNNPYNLMRAIADSIGKTTRTQLIHLVMKASTLKPSNFNTTGEYTAEASLIHEAMRRFGITTVDLPMLWGILGMKGHNEQDMRFLEHDFVENNLTWDQYLEGMETIAVKEEDLAEDQAKA